MKSIKEKELLVNFAKSLGQEVDPVLVEEVERTNNIKASIRESISKNIFKDIHDAFKQSNNKPKYEADDGPLTKTQFEQILEVTDFPKPPSLDDLMLILNEIKEETNELVQAKPEEKSPETETHISSSPDPVAESTLAERTAKFISEAPKDSYQQPDPLVVPSDMDAIRGKLKFLEQWISKVSMAGPGGGEVNLRKLDDVYRPNIVHQSFLYYNDIIKKFDFTSNITNYVDIENTSRSYGNFYDVSSQTSANVNLGQLISLGTDAGSNHISLQGNGTMLFSVAGNYIVNYSCQFVNTDTVQNDINIWLKKNGNNIVDSNSIFTIPAKKNTQIPGKIIATTPISVSVQNNDQIELYWHADTALVSLQTVAAQGAPGPDIPRTPSTIVTITKL
jgi:hypothetical protein